MKILINAGHAPNGNPDTGAVNKITGHRECDITLECSEMVAKYLNAVGYATRIIQADDLDKVCNTSNDWGADLFISIHCNAFNTKAQGTETYYLSSAGQKLAECINSQIVNSLPVIDRGTKRGDRLYVLRHTDCTAVLVELAFIDNADDVKLLTTRLDDFARAIARGVTDYLGDC